LLYFALHVLFVSHETFCFYQTVYIFIYSAYKLQVCSLNFCDVYLLQTGATMAVYDCITYIVCLIKFIERHNESTIR